MREQVFRNDPIPKAVAKLALPTMIGMLVTVVYNLADTFFVGKTGDPNQVAAVSITMPIFLLLMAFGNIFGIGGGSYISRLLGQKNADTAKRVSAFAFYVCAGLGIALGILALIFMKPILQISGASANTYRYAKDYLVIIACGSPIIMLSFALGQIIRAEGAAREALMGMMMGTVVNIILDPILIILTGQGVKGAAVATVIANVLSVGYYICHLRKDNTLLAITMKYFCVDKDMIRNILGIGIPASLASILMSLSNIILNNFAVGYGDHIVAALGVVSKITMISAMLMIGLGSGVQPLIGYNYGDKNIARMKAVIKFCVGITTVIGVAFTVIFYIGAESFVKVFLDDAQIVELGTSFLRMMIIPMPILGIQFILINTFQAIGKAMPSLVLSLARQGLIYIPALIMGNYFLGQNGLVFAQPLADGLTTILSVIFFLKIVNKLEQDINLDLREVNVRP